jgi:hypothetical protein
MPIWRTCSKNYLQGFENIGVGEGVLNRSKHPEDLHAQTRALFQYLLIVLLGQVILCNELREGPSFGFQAPKS